MLVRILTYLICAAVLIGLTVLPMLLVFWLTADTVLAALTEVASFVLALAVMDAAKDDVFP